MIKIDRQRVLQPVVLCGVNAGPKEAKRAVAFFTGRTGRRPVFRVYKLPEVKSALERVFNRKCAYCESVYEAVMPFPVEHWRPKSRVACRDGTIARGYFWLAATWENLFVSCSDCNGQREHEELPSRQKKLLGKLDRFPLADETKRAHAPGQEFGEEPLLLNPCSDDPTEHIEFFSDGKNRAIMRPRGDSMKGAESIATYGLNRVGLVRQRVALLAHIDYVKTQIDASLRELQVCRTANEERLIWLSVEKSLKRLAQMRDDSMPYSALAKSEIDAYIGSLLGQTDRSKNALRPAPRRVAGTRHR